MGGESRGMPRHGLYGNSRAVSAHKKNPHRFRSEGVKVKFIGAKGFAVPLESELDSEKQLE